jgi:predicted transcriptional regulator
MSKESELSSFVLVMGNTPFIRVVDFLLENRPFDYSKTDIAKNAEVGWSTLHGVWKVLEKTKIVRRTRIVGRSKLDEENSIVRKIIELDARISDMFANEIIDKDVKILVKPKV